MARWLSFLNHRVEVQRWEVAVVGPAVTPFPEQGSSRPTP